jgi:hypothetical protein
LDAKSVRSGKASGLKWKCPFLDNVKSILVKNPDNVHIQIAEIAASGFMLTPLKPEITQLTLSNPRFSDNTYYKNGRYNLAPKCVVCWNCHLDNKYCKFIQTQIQESRTDI